MSLSNVVLEAVTVALEAVTVVLEADTVPLSCLHVSFCFNEIHTCAVKQVCFRVYWCYVSTTFSGCDLNSFRGYVIVSTAVVMAMSVVATM